MIYPDYVKKYRPKGTIVKKVGNVFYAYNATSKRVPHKSYPVQVVSGIAGKIDEKGFHAVTSTRINIDNIAIREYGFSNYLLMFEDEYVISNQRRSNKDAKIIYRSLIAYLSSNSYLYDEKNLTLLKSNELVDKYKINILKQLASISKMIKRPLKDLDALKYICNVRINEKIFYSALTKAQIDILKELGVDEFDLKKEYRF